MIYLRNFKEEQILFYDIETVRVVDKLEPGPLKDAWDYKCRNQNEIDKKTGEPVSNEEYFHEKAALYKPFGRIVCIVAGKIDGDKLRTKRYIGEEKELLENFHSDLHKFYDAGKISYLGGFNIIKFDGPFVAMRSFSHGVIPHPLFDTAHLKPWEIQAVDLSELYKGTSFYPDSLVAVAASFGIPSPKADLDGSAVSDAFYAGEIDKISNYCRGDVLASANIFRKFLRKPFVELI